ncbi:MAG: hypothetical protein N4A54_10710 [Peptostreptococcaceae bacterium]|jgi:hypothetical protein|nr:hypothetical protein [Peptostreptococcaceae bacterium]
MLASINIKNNFKSSIFEGILFGFEERKSQKTVKTSNSIELEDNIKYDVACLHGLGISK